MHTLTLKQTILSLIPYILLIFVVTSCSKEDSTATDNNNNNSESYSCINNDCIVDDVNGTYSSLSDCQSDCSNISNQRYSCVRAPGSCDVDPNGFFTSLEACQNECTGNTFFCSNGECAINVFGEFTTMAECQSFCANKYTPITDSRDGRVYNTVQIGNQVWFSENLQYTGNIPEVKRMDWANLPENGQPAWAYLEDNPRESDINGIFYNWAAVNTGTLCPNGWRIPTKSDCEELISFLGGESVAGGQMKSPVNASIGNSGWAVGNNGATNSSGFSAIGSRTRFRNGSHNSSIPIDAWWTSTEDPIAPQIQALFLRVERSSTSAAVVGNTKQLGLTCRCVKE